MRGRVPYDAPMKNSVPYDGGFYKRASTSRCRQSPLLCQALYITGSKRQWNPDVNLDAYNRVVRFVV